MNWHRVLGCWFTALLLGLAWGCAHAAPSGYTFCSSEGQDCTIPGDAIVAYGAGEGSCDGSLTCTTGYIAVMFTGAQTLPCGSYIAGFGSDPAPGQAKACYYSLIGAAPPPAGASSPSSSASSVQLVLPDFLNLSASDGLALSVAVMAAWATAWAIRQLVRTLNVSDGDGD